MLTQTLLCVLTNTCLLTYTLSALLTPPERSEVSSAAWSLQSHTLVILDPSFSFSKQNLVIK